MDIGEPAVDPNTLTRIVQVTSAFDEVLKHPFLGGGTSSFQLAFDWQSLGEEWEEQGWIGNTEMRVLHDTGIVGLVSLCCISGCLCIAGPGRSLNQNPIQSWLLCWRLPWFIAFHFKPQRAHCWLFPGSTLGS